MTGAAAEGALTFVLCIERNALRAQALLLCESIRRFGGRHRDAPIVAVAPRPGLGLDDDDETRGRLAALGVAYAEEPLNTACPEYGSANRVFAAAWAERRAATEWIAVLDSDTVVLGELDLPEDADAAVRPVDTKGSATAGPGDPFEGYWARLAELQGLALDALPFLHTTVCGQRIRASYNGGLVVVRRSKGILGAWAELFARSVTEGLKPWQGRGLDVRASTGLVGSAAGEYWGSNQAAAALAIWSRSRRVHHYPASCNVPLHLVHERPDLLDAVRSAPLVHVHYHWLFTDPHHHEALARLGQLGLGRDRLDWLAARLPLDPNGWST
ncbi:MAG TPA: hypothetical protein VF310_17610 [Vicinamibacteria bacterium]